MVVCGWDELNNEGAKARRREGKFKRLRWGTIEQPSNQATKLGKVVPEVESLADSVGPLARFDYTNGWGEI